MPLNDIERFNAWAPRYEQGWAHKHFFGRIHGRILALAAALVPAPRRILDVGCGTGAFLRAAGARFPEAKLYGVDPAEEMIKAATAAAAGGSPKYYHAGAEDLPLPHACIDLAVTTVSFHHWADQAAGVREVARVLAPGGVFILADQFAAWWSRPLFAAAGRRPHFHTRPEFRALLESAELAVAQWGVVYRLGPFAVVAATVGRKSND